MDLVDDYYRVVTEDPDGTSLETYSVVITYIGYIYNLEVHVWECG